MISTEVPSTSNNIPSSMADCLTDTSPVEALLSLSRYSEARALTLAQELSSSLVVSSAAKGTTGSTNSHTNRRSGTSKLHSRRFGDDETNKSSVSGQSSIHHFPIPLPPSLNTSTTQNSSSLRIQQSILTTPMACAESIQHSLSKIALTGSRASSELRALDLERQSVDANIEDLSTALELRHLSTLMKDALARGNYEDCVAAVVGYRSFQPTPRALTLVGDEAIDIYTDVTVKVTMELLSRYEQAVQQRDIHGLSQLTPLLGRMHLGHKCIHLYLQYSTHVLQQLIQSATTEVQTIKRERGQYPTAIPTHQNTTPTSSKLAKIYNGGVTHLRHHLPMVVSALGEVDGDVKLLQLVHDLIGASATELLKKFAKEKDMDNLYEKADAIVTMIMDKYVLGNSNNVVEEYQDDVVASAANAIASVTGGLRTSSDDTDKDEFLDDTGLSSTLGYSLVDIDALLDESALCLQHTETYERFLLHAAEEVGKAREFRKRQQQEANSETSNNATKKEHKDDTGLVLPRRSTLEEIVSEIGGHYSGLERCLLLASMQRAFRKSFRSTNPSYSDAMYSPVGILILSNTTPSEVGESADLTVVPSGTHALQTSLVEECLYAAQRSTLRAFATGHAGTSCAAANFCIDALGRALLQVLVRKTEISTVALRPGEGLLVGQAGISQAAMSALRNVQNVTRGGKSAKSNPSSTSDDSAATATAEMRRRVQMGIARACASFNDIEVSVEYLKRLEKQLLQEVDGSFPPQDTMTEQLIMCVKSLDAVVDSFVESSDQALAQLLSQILPRVRSIVNDAVGQDGASAFSGLSGGSTLAGNVNLRMNYEMDEDAYESAQVSEGYMDRLLSNLDELINPLRVHLMPRLADKLILGAISGASKRLEMALRRSQCSLLGALCLKADVKFWPISQLSDCTAKKSIPMLAS
jgi:hypothetical protein